MFAPGPRKARPDQALLTDGPVLTDGAVPFFTYPF